MADVNQSFILEVGQTISGLERVASLVGKLESDLDSLGSSQKAGFQQSASAIQDFNKNLSSSTGHYRKIETGTKSLRKEQEQLRTVLNRSTQSQKEFIKGGKYAGMEKEIASLKARINQLNSELDKSGKASNGFGSAMGKIGGVLAGVFAVDQVIEFGKKIFGATAEFQKFNAVLTNSLGSSKKAAEAMGMIRDFAAATPFSVQELTDSYIKLTNQGLKPSAEELRKAGDLAASTGKSFDQLTEAVIDAAGGMEFERLKEFGIRAQKDGDMVKFTFKGITTEVDATSQSIKDYVLGLGDLQGVSGSMAAISQTLGGQLSNLGDTFDSLLLAIGEKLTPAFGKGMAAISFLVSGLTDLISTKEDTNKVSLETIAQNQKEANGAKGLLARYEELEKKGVKATKKEKHELNVITLKLRDSLGESVTAINKETGALELNKKAVREAINQKLLLANQEASTLALRLNVVKEQLATEQKSNADLEKIMKDRLGILTQQGLTPKMADDLVTREATGERFAKAMQEDLSVAKEWVKANREYMEGMGRGNALLNERTQIVEGLQKLGFSQADVDRLFNEAMANQTEIEPTIPAGGLSDEAKKKLEAARDALKAELEKLEKEANQARLDMMEKGSKEYLEALYKERLKEIAVIEQTIKEKELAAKKDGKLDAEQVRQINLLKAAASKEYADALFEFEKANRDKLLELTEDSDQKDMQQLIAKYDEEIRLAEKAGNKEVAIALETAKRRDAAKLGKAQTMAGLDQQEELDIATATLTVNQLEGVDEVERERLKQEKILEIQEEFAQKRLAELIHENDTASLIEKTNLKNQLEEIRQAREKMEAESEGFSIQKLLGLTDEQMEGVNIATEQILGQLSDFLAASVEMRQREVEALTNAIDEKGAELDREIELNKQGFASNVETKQQEYDELKKQREKAMKDQQKAQRAQVALDTITQSVNMITAASDIFKSVSAIPVVGVPLAIGLIATMFAAFAASKAKAMQAASVPSYERGGEGSLIKGASHKQGGIDIIERKSGKLVGNMQGGENFYVTSNKATDQFWPYLELINKQDKKGFLNLALDELLSGTGVIPHPELPQRMQTAQQGARQAQYKSVNEAYFKEMNQHLKTVASNTQQGPQLIDTPTERIYKSGNRTTIIRK